MEVVEQIPGMRAIYGRVEGVVVWLEEHADGRRIVVRKILGLSEKLA